MSFTPGPGTVRLTPSSPTGNPYVQWNTTWNNAATTFTGIRFDVTDTASAAGSLLMDLRVGGDSKFKVDKIGNVSVGSATGVGSLAIVPAGGIWPVISRDGSDGGLILGFNSGSASIKLFGTDIAISRDAADTLAQRRGGNAQAFRIYNTFTDALNYERARIAWSANVLQIGTENAGSGLARSLRIISAQEISFGVNGNGGSNWFFSTAAHFLASSDGIYDIGASGTNRPRTIYLSSAFTVGGYFSASTAGAFGAIVHNSGYIGFASGLVSIATAPDTTFFRIAAGVMGVRATSAATGGALEFLEQTAPAAPAADGVRIYAEDNGSGKTRLMARFATGAAQQIAIEP